MTIPDIIDLVAGWDDVLTFSPRPGDDTPEVAWGDVFFYYAPDQKVPTAVQPFATIVTKNYPQDELSLLDRDQVFRVNVHPGRGSFDEWAARADGDPSVLDQIVVHPVYGSVGWLAVLNPGARTTQDVRGLLREAYDLARARHHRRRT